MKHIGLFEGIGGFSLAARWAGWETVAWCEIDPFCQKVLSFHFPEAQQHGDIKTTDFSIYRGKCDILTGGFPCQPYSAAGKRLGKDDDRHLWPEMLRAILEIQPTWIVGENVRGLTNWNGGVVFDEVQADLEAIGYEVQSFILPACAVNAPHRRDRVWIVAYSSSARAGNITGETCDQRRATGKDRGAGIRQTHRATCTGWSNSTSTNGPTPNSESRRCGFCTAPYIWPSAGKINTLGDTAKIRLQQFTPNTRSEQLQEWPQNGLTEDRAEDGTGMDCGIERQGNAGATADANGNQRPERGMHSPGCETAERHACTCDARTDERPTWDNFPTQPPICGRNDGVSQRLDGITFPKWRNESIKAYGNAIVPQVAYEIFKVINQMTE